MNCTIALKKTFMPCTRPRLPLPVPVLVHAGFRAASKKSPRNAHLISIRKLNQTSLLSQNSIFPGLSQPQPVRHHSSSSAITARFSFSAPPPESPNYGPSSDSGQISDQQWNIRAGKAADILRASMPNFFEMGLVSTVHHDTNANEVDSALLAETYEHHVPDSIYAPNIRLSYTPPSALSLPVAFPKTLQVEGLPLYHASAAFIRHTLSAFNTDLHVDLCKFIVRSPGARERQILIRTIVTGKSRISGTVNEWDVHSTYTLSPHTALIGLHVVESIHPAPHVAFYDGLRAALARLAGLNPENQVGGGGMRGCVSDRNTDSGSR